MHIKAISIPFHKDLRLEISSMKKVVVGRDALWWTKVKVREVQQVQEVQDASF